MGRLSPMRDEWYHIRDSNCSSLGLPLFGLLLLLMLLMFGGLLYFRADTFGGDAVDLPFIYVVVMCNECLKRMHGEGQEPTSSFIRQLYNRGYRHRAYIN